MAAPSPKDATHVGNVFVRRFYKIMHESIDELHQFYHQDSTVTRVSEDKENKETQIGKAGIKELITKHSSAGCAPFFDSVDIQESHEQSILISVFGTLQQKDNSLKPFHQTFLLVPSDVNRFYVKNDILRFIQAPVHTEPAPAPEAKPVEAVPEPQDVPEEPAKEPAKPATASAAPEEPVEETAKANLPNGTKTEKPPAAKPPQERQTKGNAAAAAPQPKQPEGQKTYASIAAARKIDTKPNVSPAPVVVKKAPPKPAVPKSAQTKSAPQRGKDRQKYTRKGDSGNKRASRDNSVYVANLPQEFTDKKAIEDIFSQFGKVVDVSLPSKAGTNYCFVQFETSEGVKASANTNKELKLGGRRLNVEERRKERGRDGPREGRRGDGREGRRGGPQGPRNRPNRSSRGGDSSGRQPRGRK